ncbi:MAG TPA: M23 family metallopeptidase [Longimicrobiales bacterium]|jgi:hypothetical protein
MANVRASATRMALAVLVLASTSVCDRLSGPDDTSPVLSVPMVDLSTFRYFRPFGATLPGSGEANPAYELVLLGTDLEIRAVAPGIVTRIDRNDPSQGDYELAIQPSRSSRYAVIYDHVKELRVREGDRVEPGAVLGRIGNWSSTEGRVELQINRGDLAVCPRDLGTPEFNAAHEAALAASLEPAPSVCLVATVRP